MEQNWYNKIDEFLDGLLAPEERLAMENAMAQDSALARAVRLNALQRQAMEMLKDNKARQEFRDWTARAPAPGANRRYLLLLLPLLILLLLGGLIWVFQKPDTTAPASYMPRQIVPSAQPADSTEKRQPKAVVENSTKKNTEERPVVTDPKPRDREKNSALAALYEEEANGLFDANISVFRAVGDSMPEQQLFADAIQSYRDAKSEADYQQVVALLNQIKATGKLAVDVTYLKGYALFKARRYEAAADAFAGVAATGAYSKEPKWKEALSLYAAGARQKERLKNVLDGVISGSFPKAKKDQAKILMEKLR